MIKYKGVPYTGIVRGGPYVYWYEDGVQVEGLYRDGDIQMDADELRAQGRYREIAVRTRQHNGIPEYRPGVTFAERLHTQHKISA